MAQHVTAQSFVLAGQYCTAACIVRHSTAHKSPPPRALQLRRRVRGLVGASQPTRERSVPDPRASGALGMAASPAPPESGAPILSVGAAGALRGQLGLRQGDVLPSRPLLNERLKFVRKELYTRTYVHTCMRTDIHTPCTYVLSLHVPLLAVVMPQQLLASDCSV